MPEDDGAILPEELERNKKQLTSSGRGRLLGLEPPLDAEAQAAAPTVHGPPSPEDIKTYPTPVGSGAFVDGRLVITDTWGLKPMAFGERALLGGMTKEEAAALERTMDFERNKYAENLPKPYTETGGWTDRLVQPDPSDWSSRLAHRLYAPIAGDLGERPFWLSEEQLSGIRDWVAEYEKRAQTLAPLFENKAVEHTWELARDNVAALADPLSLAATDPAKLTTMTAGFVPGAIVGGAIGGAIGGVLGAPFGPAVSFLGARAGYFLGALAGGGLASVVAGDAYDAARYGKEFDIKETLKSGGVAAYDNTVLAALGLGAIKGAKSAMPFMKKGGEWVRKPFTSDAQIQKNIADAWEGQHPYGEAFQNEMLNLTDQVGEALGKDYGLNETITKPQEPRKPLETPSFEELLSPEHDGIATTDLQGLFKVETTPEGVTQYAQDKPIKNRDSLNEHMVRGHTYYMDEYNKKNPGEGAMDYVFRQLTLVDQNKRSYQGKYFRNFARKIENMEALTKEIQQYQGDPVANEHFHSYLADGKELPSHYSQDVRQFMKNLRRSLDDTHAGFQSLGEEVSKIEGYVPHAHDTSRIIQRSPEAYAVELEPLLDWKKMAQTLGRAGEEIAPAERISILEGFHEGLRETYGSMPHGGTGFKSRSLKSRFLHFRDGAAWAKYEYKTTPSVVESVIRHIHSASSNQALSRVFGPDAARNFNKLQVAANDRMLAAGKNINRPRVFSAQKLAHSLFNKGATINFSAGGVTPILHQLGQLGRNLKLKNVGLYGLSTDPITRMATKVGYGKKIKEAPGLLYKSIKDLLNDPLVKREFSVNALHREFVGPGVQVEAVDMSASALGKLNRFLRKASFGDYATNRQRAGAARDFEITLHQNLVENTWAKLNDNFKSLLRSSGITPKDWEFLRRNLKKIEELEYVYQDIGGEVAGLSQPLLTTRKLLETSNERAREIGFKLQIAIEKYSDRAVLNGQENSMSPFIGKQTTNTLMRGLYNGLTEFTGYQFQGLLNILEDVKNGQYWAESGSQASKSQLGSWTKRLGTFYAKEFATSFLHRQLKLALQGRTVNWDDPDEIKRELTTVALSSIPLPVLSSALSSRAAYGDWSLRGWGASTSSKSMLSVGITTPIEMIQNAADFVEALIDDDKVEMVESIRRLMPFTDWLPVDLMANRLLFDNLAASAHPHPYAYFQDQRSKEKKRGKKGLQIDLASRG